MTANIILPPEQLQLVLGLTQLYLPGVEVWAYGSRVRGNPRPYSDLDLVAFAVPEQSPQAGNLREAFEESDLPIRVDLFLWDELPDSFRRQIEREFAVLQHAGENAPAVQSPGESVGGEPVEPSANSLDPSFDRLRTNG